MRRSAPASRSRQSATPSQWSRFDNATGTHEAAGGEQTVTGPHAPGAGGAARRRSRSTSRRACARSIPNSPAWAQPARRCISAEPATGGRSSGSSGIREARAGESRPRPSLPAPPRSRCSPTRSPRRCRTSRSTGARAAARCAAEPLYRDRRRALPAQIPAGVRGARDSGAALLPLPTAKAIWFGRPSSLIVALVALSLGLLPERRKPAWLLRDDHARADGEVLRPRAGARADERAVRRGGRRRRHGA